VALGLLLTTAQVAVACALSGRSSLPDAYHALLAHDSYIYQQIAEVGYIAPDLEGQEKYDGTIFNPTLQTNIGLMPGYPLVVRFVGGLTGLPGPTALLLTAQLGCWAFWTYLLLFAQRWGLGTRLTGLALLLVAVHPALFFLVAGYPESLYLATLLGFLYWLERPGPSAGVLTAAHGFAMGATRLFGLPLAIYPLVRAWLRRKEGGPKGWRRWVGPLLLGGAVAAGGLLFFVYCHVRFGHWDMQMRVLRQGWGVWPQYLALFSPRIFHVNFPRTDHGFLDPDSFSRVLVPITLFTFLILLGLEGWLACRGRPTGWRQRWGLYLCAALMFYVNVSGRASVKMMGMVRYDLSVYVLLVLCLVHMLTQAPVGRPRRVALVLLVLWCLCGLFLQLAFVYRFTHGLWVA
jgi:hypothetical protein